MVGFQTMMKLNWLNMTADKKSQQVTINIGHLEDSAKFEHVNT